MKKILTVLSLMMMAVMMSGCGNTPDGDKQRLSESFIVR